MSLEVLYNEYYHTHENDQFRRIANGLINFFEEKSWDGLLIANPENENFSRFRADAILFYHRAFIIIDLKDYKGNLELPLDESSFSEDIWYLESDNDLDKLEIKGGSHGNPFRQLRRYRTVFYELLDHNPHLSNCIVNSRVQTLNIFSGPLSQSFRVPGAFRYYHITDEDHMYDKLVDINQKDNVNYTEESVKILKRIFPGKKWNPSNKPSSHNRTFSRNLKVSTDFDKTVTDFLSDDNTDILILESMSSSERDTWVKAIKSYVPKFNIPHEETIIHSTRIKNRIRSRSDINSDSIFSVIYRGNTETENEAEDTNENDSESIQDIIGIKSSKDIPDASLIILHESHLVTRSLHETDILKFGTGRLLEDLLTFLDLKNTKRKLVCIGDPYSLSFGSHEDSIHSDSCIETLGDFNYIKFKSSILNNSNSLESLKYNLAESIKNNSFTYIEYKWDYSLIETNKEDTLSKIKHWVSNISDQEPCKSILRYKREDAYRVNMWIKNRCLSNGDSINTGDLLIVNSNVNIVDNTGIGTPTRINNGDYLLIVENIREEVIQQSIKQSRFPVPLYFTRALVKCISHPEKVVTEVLLLSNQLKNSDNLTKEEQIAIKVLISTRVKNKTKKDPFENSSEYRSMLVDQSYADLEVEIEKLEQQLESGFKVKTKLEGKRIEQNKIIKLYKSRYNRTIRREIYIEDPYVNAINCNYGWALTVHKAVGSEFEEIIFDVDQGNNQGNNESYFRWLYSGLNSSNRIVNILNQLSIHPMKGCRIELEPSAHSSSKSKYQKLDFSNSGIEYKKYSEMVISNVNYLIKVIEMQYGSLWKYYSVARKGAYQTKLTLLNTVSEEQYEFIISNDGKENITSIRATKLDDKSSGIIKSIYSFEVIEKSDELPSYLNSINKVYDQWKEIAVQYDIEVIVKNRMPWYDIIEIKGKDEVIDLKMTYNKKGFFSKAQFLTEEKSKFVKQIMSIIKHD